MNLQIAKLLTEMIEYDKGDALRIQHLIKVHGFAAAISRLVNLFESDSNYETAQNVFNKYFKTEAEKQIL